MATRNRVSVNFSKKYSKEYEMLLKEKNASELICKLLHKHYNGSISNEDIMDKLNVISDALSGVNIIKDNEDEDLDDAIDAWD